MIILIKNMIECIYFIYSDFGEKDFDDKYLFL